MRCRSLVYGLLLLLLTACSETKYVSEGDYLLDRIKLKSDTKARYLNLTELRSSVRQHGNSRWFSAAKIPLATYSLSGRDTTRWVNRMLRSIGEAPVLYDSLSTQSSAANLEMQMRNKGYLRATVDVDNTIKGKRLRTTYLLHPGEPYFLRNIQYDIQDSAIAVLLANDDVMSSGLRSGMLFTADNLNAERTRITRYLADRGYYRFNKDFINYRADSVEGSNIVDLVLVLQPYRDARVSNVPHQVYHIGKLRYLSGNVGDSIIPLRRQVLRNNTFLEENALYAARDLQNTYNHFGRLDVVRYTNISFHEHPEEPVLDCDIQLSTNKPSTLSFQPEGTNTAGDLGAAATLTYQNRNIFHGSENLTIELRGAYESIKGLEGYSTSNYVEYSVGSRLTFPRFIAPLLARSFRRRINATSEVSAQYDMQNRPEFYRRVFSVAWKYKWHDQNHHDRYQVDVLDLNYISMPWISETFRNEYLENTTSRNSILRYNYENLFVMKLGFGYSYNNGDGTFDYTRNLRLDYNNQLVFHVGLGIAYPYGNSRILPFEKRYFSGGANSVRGWSVRSLGPGKFVGHDGRIDFINQTGDMKLDLNVEYRAHLFWKFNGALFVDAGNIWTLREYEEQPGGQFRFSTFLDQLAASYGLGLRLNFDYFIIRFDMGMKAVNPAYETTDDHFPLLHPRLNRDFAFHFAVGLPF